MFINLSSILSANAHLVCHSLKSFAKTKRLIKIVGAVESHDPQPDLQAPKDVLPAPTTDFKRYRANAQQHGPLARSGHFPSRQTNENSAARSDIVLDRDDLPPRFRRLMLTPEE